MYISGTCNSCAFLYFPFQPHVAHEANRCFKLLDNVNTMEGVLIKPLAGGFHAANQGCAHTNQTAVVMGAGCIGLVSMMALKAEGVSRVYVVDIMQNRLDKALELGADGVINSRKNDAVQTILDLTDELGCGLVKANNLPLNLSVHSLRHTNASLLIAQGVDVRTVASLLGHAQASTTLDIYAHAFDKNKRKAQEKPGKTIGL